MGEICVSGAPRRLCEALYQVSVECTPRGGAGCGIRAPQADSSSRTWDAEHVNGP